MKTKKKTLQSAVVWTRGLLATIFVGFGFALLWLSSVSAEYILSQSGGALAIVLFVIGVLLLAAAVWQYRLLVLRAPFSLNETLLLSPVLLLLVLPLSLATASYGEPLFVFALAILLGLLPPAISVASEKI